MHRPLQRCGSPTTTSSPTYRSSTGTPLRQPRSWRPRPSASGAPSRFETLQSRYDSPTPAAASTPRTPAQPPLPVPSQPHWSIVPASPTLRRRFDASADSPKSSTSAPRRRSSARRHGRLVTRSSAGGRSHTRKQRFIATLTTSPTAGSRRRARPRQVNFERSHRRTTVIDWRRSGALIAVRRANAAIQQATTRTAVHRTPVASGPHVR